MLTTDWNNEFIIMCDASDYAMELYWDIELKRYSRPYTMPVAVLGQRTKKIFKAIYYSSKTFNEA